MSFIIAKLKTEEVTTIQTNKMNMEQLILFLITIVATNAASLEPNCNDETHYTVHEDCDKFYQCSNGELIPQSCPEGLYFNPDKQVCDWTSNVRCKPHEAANLETSTQKDFATISIRVCSIAILQDYLWPHENCNQFYQCVHGRPYEFTCPSNLVFQPVTQICDWPQNVFCGVRVIPETEQTTESGFYGWIASKLCSQPSSGSWLLPHDSCNQFYQCSNGRPVAFDCPVHLRFSISSRVCDWPDRVICGIRYELRATNDEVVSVIEQPKTVKTDVLVADAVAN